MKTLSLSMKAFVPLLLLGSFAATQAQPKTPTKEQVWQQIKRYDALVSQGQVKYKRVISNKGKSEIYSSDLTYASDGRYVEIFALPGLPGTSIKRVFDGQDSFTSVGKQVTITSGLPVGNRPSLFWVMQVEPRPSLVMGRGLTGLKDPQVSLNGRWVTVKGKLEDGTSLSAQVDTQDHFLVRKATRFNKDGGFVGSTITTGALAGGLSAAKAVYTWGKTTETTTFSSVRFSAPASSLFKFPIRGQYTILDQRLGDPITLNKRSTGELSKERVLQISRKALHQQVQRQMQQQAALDSAQRKQTITNLLLMVSPLLLLGGWFFLGRRQKKPLTNQSYEELAT